MKHKLLHEDKDGCVVYVPKMAEGGMVSELWQNLKNSVSGEHKQESKDAWLKNAKESYAPQVKEKKEGKARGWAEGGQIPDEEQVLDPEYNVNLDASQFASAPPQPSMLEKLGNVLTANEDFSGLGGMPSVTQPSIANVVKAAGMKPEPREPLSIPDIGVASAQPQQSPYAQALPTSGIDQQIAGIQREAAAHAQLGAEQAAIQQRNAELQQDLMWNSQVHAKQYEQESAAIIDDLKNSRIDPMKFWNDKSTGSKISTAIGLILGGIGGAAGQSNVALEFLNKNIDRELEGQRQEMGRKQNLLSALNQQFGNQMQANQMFKVISLDKTMAQLAEAAGKAASPMAQAKADQAIGVLKQQKDQLLYQMGARSAAKGLLDAGKLSPAQGIQVFVPKEQQQKAIEQLEKHDAAVSAVKNVETFWAQMDKVAGSAWYNPQSSQQMANITIPFMAAMKPVFGNLSDADQERVAKGLLNNAFTSKGTSQQKLENLKKLIIQGAGSDSLLRGNGIPVPTDKIPKTRVKPQGA